MKKKLIILAVLFNCIAIYSQNKTSFGLRGGMNISKLTNTDLTTKSSVYAGVFLQIKLTDFYALQPELGYSNQGGDAKNNLLEDVDIHYITIEIANKFFINNTGLHFILAPGINFDYDDTFVGISNRNEGNDVTFIDVTISAGFGYEFNNGFSIEARYKSGMVDIFSGSWHNYANLEYEEENQFNSVLQFGIVYKFNFSKQKG